MQDTELSERYLTQFGNSRREQAWGIFQEKHFSSSLNLSLEMRFGNMLLSLLSTYNSWCCYLDGNVAKCRYRTRTRAQDDQLAMLRSEKMGKQKATLVLPEVGRKLN
ncbi:MAG: hypothetical protein ACLVL2_03645 [Bacteroides cellulosilyticus]